MIKIENWIYLLIFLCFINCKQRIENDQFKNSQKINNSELIDENLNTIVNIKTLDSIQYITNNNLANLPFGFKLNLDNIDDFFHEKDSLSVKKITSINTHNGETDTIISYLSDKKQFIFLKSRTGNFLNSAVIKDKLINLDKGIHVGISKNDFFDKIGNESTSINIVEIINEEEYSNHKFYFENNELIKIVIYHSVD